MRKEFESNAPVLFKENDKAQMWVVQFAGKGYYFATLCEALDYMRSRWYTSLDNEQPQRKKTFAEMFKPMPEESAYTAANAFGAIDWKTDEILDIADKLEDGEITPTRAASLLRCKVSVLYEEAQLLYWGVREGANQ